MNDPAAKRVLFLFGGFMTIDTGDLLGSILASLDRIKYIEPEDIPGIDLYMDQVTSFMDRRLRSTSRYPGEDRTLTKTMINNYAKNEALTTPHPETSSAPKPFSATMQHDGSGSTYA